MPSSMPIWELVKEFPNTIVPERTGVYTLLPSDAFCEKLLVKRLPKGFICLFGGDLTKEWVDNNLLSVGLFSSSESFIILFSESIRADVKKYILSASLELDSYLIFSFSKKDKFYEQLNKSEKTLKVEVSAPRFWEMDKLLLFLAQVMRIQLTPLVKNYVISNVGPTTANYVAALNILRLNSGDNIDLKKLEEIIPPSKFDYFEMASDFSKKNFERFFKKMRSLNFDDLRALSSFMQGHLIKLCDTSYMQAKRISKYDKSIMEHSKNWNQELLLNYVRYFEKIEIEAKRSNSFVYHSIQQI